jgi:hypothetical protein
MKEYTCDMFVGAGDFLRRCGLVILEKDLITVRIWQGNGGLSKGKSSCKQIHVCKECARFLGL